MPPAIHLIRIERSDASPPGDPRIAAAARAADFGLDVPRDLSVVGVTDIQLARESRPALTTIAVATIEAAELAVGLLTELVEATDSATGAAARVCVVSAPRLVVRASTAAPRAKG